MAARGLGLPERVGHCPPRREAGSLSGAYVEAVRLDGVGPVPDAGWVGPISRSRNSEASFSSGFRSVAYID